MKEYIYFISSLPSIYIDKQSSITYEEFLEKAREQLSKKDFEILKNAKLKGNGKREHNKTLREWINFSYKINELLTEERAHSLSLSDKGEYKARCERDSILEKRIREIVSLDNPLTSEKELLSLYFDYLSLHEDSDPFSLNSLINYSLKLQLKEKSDSFSQEKGSKEFDRLYSSIENKIREGNK